MNPVPDTVDDAASVVNAPVDAAVFPIGPGEASRSINPWPDTAPDAASIVADTVPPDWLTAVVAFPAVNPAAVPVTLVITPDIGVPRAGATSVLLDRLSVPANVANVPATLGSVIVIDADCANTVLNSPVVVKFPAKASCPVVSVKPDPPALTTTASPALPE